MCVYFSGVHVNARTCFVPANWGPPPSKRWRIQGKHAFLKISTGCSHFCTETTEKYVEKRRHGYGNVNLKSDKVLTNVKSIQLASDLEARIISCKHKRSNSLPPVLALR